MNALVDNDAVAVLQRVREEPRETAFGHPRDSLSNRFVYLTVSPRARGLSVGVNLNPDRRCNFDCVYCEVDRRRAEPNASVDLSVLAAELESTINLVRSGKLSERPPYTRLPADLLLLRHVAISGHGEPTLSPQFLGAVETVVHVRAVSEGPFFKIVLITNGSNLDADAVQDGIRLLTSQDEIWVKLDAGTPAHMNLVNKPEIPFEKVLSNILLVGRRRGIVIQSLFPAIDGAGPNQQQIDDYALQLEELVAAGAQIQLVQIYSATRPVVNAHCGHLPLRALSDIARRVRDITGLKVEVF